MSAWDIDASWGLRDISTSFFMEILQVFEPFRVKMGGEVVDHLIEVTFENLFELVQSEPSPVVGDTVLRKIIGPDPFRPVA